eukprot:11634190-Heterocapsa_arctica.AAC.1
MNGRANWRPFFAAGTGKSSVDQVWRAAVAAEEAIATKGTSAASFLWDITKFYEHFSHNKL